MTKTLRSSLVILALATTGIFAVESASAAPICLGGHILPKKCGKPAFAGSIVCQCNGLGSPLTVTEVKGNSGNPSPGGDPEIDTGPDVDTEIDTLGE